MADINFHNYTIFSRLQVWPSKLQM